MAAKPMPRVERLRKKPGTIVLSLGHWWRVNRDGSWSKMESAR